MNHVRVSILSEDDEANATAVQELSQVNALTTQLVVAYYIEQPSQAFLDELCLALKKPNALAVFKYVGIAGTSSLVGAKLGGLFECLAQRDNTLLSTLDLA